MTGAIAIGGIGGSGTRVPATILKRLGVYIGDELSPAKDNLWYALLFGRRDILLTDPAAFEAVAELFCRTMSRPAPLTPADRDLLAGLAAQHRIQHAPDDLTAWADSFAARADGGSAWPDAWGWKVPYTYVVIDRLLARDPALKYVHMARNGADMAFSRNQMQLAKWGPVFLNRDVEVGPRDALSFWCAVHRHVARVTAHNPDRILHLSFDALVEDPQGQLDRFYDFLGIAPTPAQRDEFAGFVRRPKSLGRHRDHDLSVFRAEDLEYLAAIGQPVSPGRAPPTAAAT
jgi:hypothetical protein